MGGKIYKPVRMSKKQSHDIPDLESSTNRDSTRYIQLFGGVSSLSSKNSRIN